MGQLGFRWVSQQRPVVLTHPGHASQWLPAAHRVVMLGLAGEERPVCPAHGQHLAQG